MKLTQIRNATVLLEYGGNRFLIDPMLSPKGNLPPFHSYIRPAERNPLTDLPVPIEDILRVDAVIVTHLHPDHFDKAARDLLPKELPIFSQNQNDADVLCYCGFQDVRILGEDTVFRNVELSKTPGQHGNWEEKEQIQNLCSVCGVVFQSPVEPCLYVTGDTIWYRGVEQTVNLYQPNIILANAGANMAYHHRLLMSAEDVLHVHEALPGAVIVAIHMEDLNHCTLSRTELRQFAIEKNFGDRLAIPQNGEVLSFTGKKEMIKDRLICSA